MQTRDWSWATLNTLCWAIGSISGSMQEEQENRFLISVIRWAHCLCQLCQNHCVSIICWLGYTAMLQGLAQPV